VAQFSFIFEQGWDVAKELRHKFSGGDGGAVGAPKAGLGSVLQGAGFAIGKLDDDFFGAAAGIVSLLSIISIIAGIGGVWVGDVLPTRFTAAAAGNGDGFGGLAVRPIRGR